MSREIQSLFALNRGVVSRYGLARMDVKRLAMAAETQENFLPRVLGGAMLRPGLGYLGSVFGNAAARFLKFIFSTTDTALIELTDSLMRVWISDSLLTRPSVSTIVTNGTFTTDLSGWIDSDESGAVSQWSAPGYMELVGTGSTRAIRDQLVYLPAAAPGIEHALRIVVVRGPVTLRVGSTLGGDEYVSETTLYTGTHSIAFTPTAEFYIRFASAKTQKIWISNCTIEASGVVTLPTPWTAANLGKVRSEQSGDVLFCACYGFQQRRIERRGTGRSWSVVNYGNENGPFRASNLTTISITPSGTSGNITLAASLPVFKSTHVGALFSLTSQRTQQVSTTSNVSGTNGSSVRVTGTGQARLLLVRISGNGSGSTINLQRSYDNLTWSNVLTKVWTTNINESYLDGLDNQTDYYRLQLTTCVAPDNVTMQLQVESGSTRGYVRITGYTSPISVAAEVLSDLGGTTATTDWKEGVWSDYRGWPSSVRIHEGRMWWAGKNGVIGSISDAYESFDETAVGDSAPINRTIGSGPVDTINWIQSLKGLVLGSQGSEIVARASSLEDPLTPTNFNLKYPSSQGSGAVDAIKVDKSAFFVNRSGMKIFAFDFDPQAYDYSSNSAMELCPEIGYPGVVRMDAQRQPDTRLHCVLSDGSVAMLVYNKLEEVSCWIKVTTNGFIEDVVVLPAATGNLDDQVYYVVRRTINGNTVRYLEKWAQETNCRGDLQYCHLADAYVMYSGVRTNVITGLSHLEGQNVVVWADGLDVGTVDGETRTQTYTVSGGQITLATSAATVVVGLGYTATFKSAKLGSSMQGHSSLNQQKRIGHIGIIAADIYRLGLKYGPSLDYLDDMPLIESGTEVTDGTTANYDNNQIEFPGEWTTDSRVCLQAYAPRPCHVLAVTMDEVQYP